MDLKRKTPVGLLRLHADVIEELRSRDIVTTANAPLGGYAEWLFCKAFGWKPAPNSTKDFDAEDGKKRIQIKARRLHPRNKSRQLGAIRRVEEKNFDLLAAALFDQDYKVMRAALIPFHWVAAKAKPVPATNSVRFMLVDEVWSWRGVKDVTDVLRHAQ